MVLNPPVINPIVQTPTNMLSKPLNELKQELKELLPEEGMGAVMQALEKHLPPDAPKYNVLLQLKARLNELNLKRIKNLLSDEDFTLQNDQLRFDVLTFLDGLEDSDFSAQAAKQAKMGSVLYRIPHKMEVQKEAKCIVRLAFDESIIIQNIELTADATLKAVRVSEAMEVSLLDPFGGENFAIRTLSSPEQFLEKDDYTEWVFYAKPLKEGSYPIALKISVLEIINGKERKKEVVLEELITIVSKPVEKEKGDDTYKHAGYAFAFAPLAATRTTGGWREVIRKYGNAASLAVIGIIMALFGFNNHHVNWKITQWQDSATAYEGFTEKFPESSHLAEATERFDFKSAVASNSPEKALYYLAKYGTLSEWNTSSKPADVQVPRAVSQAASQATAILSANLGTSVNLDSLVANYREQHQITPVDWNRTAAPIGNDNDQTNTNKTGNNRGNDSPSASQSPGTDPAHPVAHGTTDPAATSGGADNPATSTGREGTLPSANSGSAAHSAGGGTSNPANSGANSEDGSASKISWNDTKAAVEDPLNWLPTTMVPIKSGVYKMGCLETEEGGCAINEVPSHEVRVEAFHISRFEVTQALWKAVMGKNPSRFDDCDLCPVERVSWNDAHNFIEKLNELTGQNYRLPTEAEWEYAARQAGKRVRFGNGNQKASPADINFSTEDMPTRKYADSGVSLQKTVGVFDMKPNALGLYHMAGNVFEWCEDRWHENYESAPADGSAWVDGKDNRRIIRGGGWDSEPYAARTFVRDGKSAGSKDDEVGFRLVW
jgi:formylglycine-generating enzyme required for sulfatase activity